MTKFSLALFALCSAAVSADPEDPVLPPVAWPTQHTHLEVCRAGAACARAPVRERRLSEARCLGDHAASPSV